MEEVQRALGRVEGKLDSLIATVDKQNGRLSAVEKKVWYFSGIGTAISLFFSWFNK